jgi:hypothetical protein
VSHKSRPLKYAWALTRHQRQTGQIIIAGVCVYVACYANPCLAIRPDRKFGFSPIEISDKVFSAKIP